MTYSCERLAYWYFRLNGFLTTENFIVHPDYGRNQRTDADMLAVRFKNRAENRANPMTDSPSVSNCDRLVNVVIAEVKTGVCALNGPWTDPRSENMQRVLSAIGCVDRGMLEEAASALYDTGSWRDGAVGIRLFAVGRERSDLIIGKDQQITWDEIVQFCIERFNDYKRQKSSVGQWSSDGRALQRLALDEDVAGIRRLFRVLGGGDTHV